MITLDHMYLIRYIGLEGIYVGKLEKAAMKPKKTTRQKNPSLGSSFQDFLKAEGSYDELTSAAIKRSLAIELAREMAEQLITKVEMARRMETSRSQLNRLLDPENDKIQLDTLYKAATALGKSLTLELR